MNKYLAAKRLERAKEKEAREAEILEARVIARAYPELTYGEALRHAFVKLRKQSKGK